MLRRTSFTTCPLILLLLDRVNIFSIERCKLELNLYEWYRSAQSWFLRYFRLLKINNNDLEFSRPKPIPPEWWSISSHFRHQSGKTAAAKRPKEKSSEEMVPTKVSIAQ